MKVTNTHIDKTFFDISYTFFKHKNIFIRVLVINAIIIIIIITVKKEL
jgi:hypothetical protein